MSVEDQLTSELGGWVREAYKVGGQEHLGEERSNDPLQRPGGPRARTARARR